MPSVPIPFRPAVKLTLVMPERWPSMVWWRDAPRPCQLFSAACQWKTDRAAYCVMWTGGRRRGTVCASDARWLSGVCQLLLRVVCTPGCVDVVICCSVGQAISLSSRSFSFVGWQRSLGECLMRVETLRDGRYFFNVLVAYNFNLLLWIQV